MTNDVALSEQELAEAGEDFDFDDFVTFKAGKLTISAKDAKQNRYLNSMMSNDITFGIGPAGTGKTLLAVAMGVYALQSRDEYSPFHDIEKIIIARPLVEAGEKMGFLPGTIEAKTDPYLRPIYDAFEELVGLEQLSKWMDPTKRTVEVAPLAYLRGRNLKNAFVIIDEAQNATISQTRMFLTRLSEASHMVVTGDVDQIDLPNKRMSGLLMYQNLWNLIDSGDLKVKEPKGIDVISLDVVYRHPVVDLLIEQFKAYDDYNEQLRLELNEKRKELPIKDVESHN